MRSVTERQLRNSVAATLRRVEAGEHLTVTRNGTPVAELRPVGARRFVERAVIEAAATTAPRIDAERFRADLDALVDQEAEI
ncbi:MAG: type II toxin-antitoxin system prevent-host-death family antitoxin [Gemmatimonadota bacterium]|nr:type II toxin-antitoxin system prevent-host-death family antitoxin [Gemmatimonadota bacterium]